MTRSWIFLVALSVMVAVTLGRVVLALDPLLNVEGDRDATERT